MDDEAENLTRIELWGDSIEPSGVYGFKLRGIDAPLIRSDLHAIEDGRQGVADMSAFAAADDAAGPQSSNARYSSKLNRIPL